MPLQKHPELYKKDSAGKVRVWWVETDRDQYRVVSGLRDGKLVESDWKTAVPKNIGRSNETTGPEQALSECQSLYDKQLKQGKYHESLDTIDEDGYFEPMLAIKWDDDKGKREGIKVIEKAFASGKKVFTQPKLDGIRNLATIEKMTSREGEERVSCPHIFEQARGRILASNYSGIILDGELYNHDYHDNFNKLQSLILQRKPGPEELAESAEKVQYHVYDAFLPEEPEAAFERRIFVLSHVLRPWAAMPSIHIVMAKEVKSFEEIDEAYGSYLDQGYEGMVIRIDSPYENKRSKTLIKRKEFFDEEFPVVEIIEGRGNWNEKAKAVSFIYNEAGDVTEAGISGSEAQMADLLRRKGLYENGKGQVTVRFPNKTPDGKPRFGVAKAFYEGKRTD